MTKQKKWKAVSGSIMLTDRRSVKPVGRLYILGKYLTPKESSNYLNANKRSRDV